MTLVHALYQSAGHDPVLIRLPLPERRGHSSRAVAIPVVGDDDPTTFRVTASVGEPAGRTEGNPTFPVTLGRKETSVTLAPIAITGDRAFETTSGVGGVLVLDSDEPETEALAGVDDVAIVAVVAILVIGAMVVAATGGSFSGKAGDVEVSAQPADDDPPPSHSTGGGHR
jgi:hypothetical protein